MYVIFLMMEHIIYSLPYTIDSDWTVIRDRKMSKKYCKLAI
jgi:hypothetical protein